MQRAAVGLYVLGNIVGKGGMILFRNFWSENKEGRQACKGTGIRG